MFKRLHTRLTLLCTVTTGGILIFLVMICEMLSENAINTDAYNSFLTQKQSLITQLEANTLISGRLLSELYENANMQIFLFDNDTPVFDLLYENNISLISDISDYYKNMYDTDIIYPDKDKPYDITDEGYSYDGTDYYSCCGSFFKNDSRITYIILFERTGTKGKIRTIRFMLFSVCLVAVGLLYFFFRLLTKKLIIPVEDAQKKQTRFIASASHELRTPLAVLKASLEVLAESNDKERIAKMLSICNTRIIIMQRLIDNMLTLASLNDSADGKKIIQPSVNGKPYPTTIDNMLIELYDKFAPLAAARNISLSLKLPDEISQLPPADEKLYQLLYVAIDNLIHAAAEGDRVRISYLVE